MFEGHGCRCRGPCVLGHGYGEVQVHGLVDGERWCLHLICSPFSGIITEPCDVKNWLKGEDVRSVAKVGYVESKGQCFSRFPGYCRVVIRRHLPLMARRRLHGHDVRINNTLTTQRCPFEHDIERYQGGYF